MNYTPDESKFIHINDDDDPYDTSAFNIDYSDQEDEPSYIPSVNPKPSATPKSYLTKAVPAKPAPTKAVPAKHMYQHDTDGVTTDDDIENDFEYNNNARPSPPVVSKFPGSQSMSVDEYGFVIKPNQPNSSSPSRR